MAVRKYTKKKQEIEIEELPCKSEDFTGFTNDELLEKVTELCGELSEAYDLLESAHKMTTAVMAENRYIRKQLKYAREEELAKG